MRHSHIKMLSSPGSEIWLLTAMAITGFAAAHCAVISNTYAINLTDTHQVILGLGYEIQSDSIGSGNHGLPNSNASVPWDLVPTERTRFFREMLSGFRYCRLALGLYLRGLTANESQIIERWPGQIAGLAEMASVANIEGFDVEYWSPAPAFKSNSNYINGALVSTNSTFLTRFAEAVVQDLRYLQANGLNVTQFGLQNEVRALRPVCCLPAIVRNV